jgi:hypothetical protein
MLTDTIENIRCIPIEIENALYAKLAEIKNSN